MARIAQIIPYFGRWPEWIELYLYSCSRNQMMDFIIYTDCQTESLPEYDNVKIVKTTISEYERLVSMRLGIDYKMASHYKLTDLKPFLGAIHEEELKDYDFWSFGDIDLCYGDLSSLINENNLRRYELITTHCYHIAGHLTVIRNNSYYRDICFKIADWRTKLIDNKHYSLDEGEWSQLVCLKLKWGRAMWKYLIRRLKVTDFFTFMDNYNKLFIRKQLLKEYYTSPAPNANEKWEYNLKNGNITDGNGRNLPYLHFLFFKKTPWLKTENHWHDNYYRLTENVDNYHKIEFSLEGINGIKVAQ